MPLLQPTLSRIVHDPLAVEDIIQEVFIRIWINRDQLKDIQNPRAWILRIAYTRAFSFLSHLTSYNKKLVAYSGRIRQKAVDPEEVLAFRSIKNLVGQAVRELPRQQKIVYKLSREEGMAVADIAAAMSLSPQSVKNTLGRALSFIRAYIERAGYVMAAVWYFF